jgi:hypothetical protein
LSPIRSFAEQPALAKSGFDHPAMRAYRAAATDQLEASSR